MKTADKNLLYENVITNIKRDIFNSEIAGASVLVAQSGEIILDECLGYSDIEKKSPLKRDSVFRIASMTKPITAVAALVAEERGFFSLNDNISRHFPQFSDMKVGRAEQGRAVFDSRPFHKATLKDLLSHTSGFMCSSPIYAAQYKAIPKSEFESGRRMVSYCLENTFLTFPPCESVGYGPHLPFDMLAVLIEDKSKMSFSDFISENILMPLGMCDTTYTPTQDQWQRLVTMCDREKNSSLHNVELGRHIFEDYPLTYNSAGAGLVGTASDYLKFAEMLRRGGEYLGRRIISRGSAEKISGTCVPSSVIGANSTTTFGLSVRVVLRGYPFLTEGSYGWSGAYGTHFFIDPKNEITAIYMKNTYRYDSLGAGKTGRDFEKAVTNALR